MIACSVDDFPAPFGPISPTISPGATSSESPRTAVTRPVPHLEPLHDECRARHDGPSWTALSPR